MATTYNIQVFVPLGGDPITSSDWPSYAGAAGGNGASMSVDNTPTNGTLYTITYSDPHVKPLDDDDYTL